MSEQNKPKSNVGPKIYVESLMTDSEYAECAVKYNYPNGPKKIPYFKSEFAWRYRMGLPLTVDEIVRINNNIKLLLERKLLIEKN